MIKDQVKKLFKSNSTYKTLYGFSDGNIFSDINFAKNHQRTSGKTMETFNREDFSYNEPEPKADKTKGVKKLKEVKKPKEGHITTIQDQLKNTDLEKCDGKDYKALRQLHDGLGLKSENKKFQTIFESLKKAKAELLKPKE